MFGSFDENEVNSNSKKKAGTSSPIFFSSSRGGDWQGGREDSTKGQEEVEEEKKDEEEEEKEEKERKRGEGKSYYGEQSRACWCNQINQPELRDSRTDASVGAHHTRPRYQLAKLYPVWASSIFHLGQLLLSFSEKFVASLSGPPSLLSIRSFPIFAPNFSPQFFRRSPRSSSDLSVFSNAYSLVNWPMKRKERGRNEFSFKTTRLKAHNKEAVVQSQKPIPLSGETTPFIARRERGFCILADAGLTSEGVNRTSCGARANMDAESIHSPNAGPLKRITRLILDCKIERGEKKRKRKGGTGRDGDIEERKAYLWRNIDLWRGSVSRGRETVPLV